MAVNVDILGPAPVDPLRDAAHGADARRRRAGHRRLPARGERPVPGRARAAALRQERPLLLDAVHRPALHRPRLRVRAAGRARQVPLRTASRWPSSTRCPTATTRSSGSRRSRGRTATSACGATATTASRSGPRWRRGHPALKAIVPRVTIADIDALARGRDAALRRPLPGGVLDRPQHQRVADRLELAGRWPGCSTRASGARDALARRSTTCSHGRAAPPRHAVYPGDTPVRRAAHPDPARRRLVRQHHAAAHARLRGADAEPADGAVPVPARGLDRPRELPDRERADPRARRPRDATTTRWSRCSRATSGPALDFFDAFLSGRADPAAVPRVRWHLPRVGLAGLRELAAARRTELRLYLADAELAGGDAARRVAGRRARPGAARRPGRTTRGDPCRRRSSIPSPRVFEYPDEREVEARADVMVFTTPAWDEPVTLAGRVVAHLRVARRRAVDLPARQARRRRGRTAGAHAALRPAGGRASRAAGRPRRCTSGTPATASRPGRRLRLHVATSDFPVFLLHPGTDENPWDATETRTNRQTLATGGESASYVSLTVL